MKNEDIEFDQKFSAVVSFQNENSDIETSTIFVILRWKNEYSQKITE